MRSLRENWLTPLSTLRRCNPLPSRRSHEPCTDALPGRCGLGWHLRRALAGAGFTRRLAALAPDVGVGDYRPTDQAAEVLQKLTGEIHQQIAAFDELVNQDIAEFNAMLTQYQLKAIG